MNKENDLTEIGDVLVVGCGDIGMRVARLWQERRVPVRGLARSKESAARLFGAGIVPVAGDLDRIESLHLLKLNDSLLYYLAPPQRAGVRDERIRALLRAHGEARPARVVYLSTTGVYGDRGGEWVDETTPPAPGTDRARRRLDAETVVRAWGRERGVAVSVLRVPGIYGPGRLPRRRIEEGTPVVDPSEAPWSNRIHADDLAETCVAAALRGAPDAIYNVSDGEPGTMTEYVLAVADALGLPRPPIVSMAEARRSLDPGLLSFLSESRRVDNRRMLEELDVRPRYASLREGIAARLPRE